MPTSRSSSCAISIWTRSSWCAIAGPSIATAGPTPTTSWWSGSRTMATTLIKNGRVVSTTGVIAQDVLVTDEVITAVGSPGFFADEGNALVIDAAGKYVIPGGVDVHTHMELPFGGTFASDTFETGTRAAAWGGVTTIVDMAVQRYSENVFDGLAAWHRKAEGN